MGNLKDGTLAVLLTVLLSVGGWVLLLCLICVQFHAPSMS